MPHPHVSRSDQHFYFSWATQNPALFAESMQSFQAAYPIQEWRHHVDLSLKGQITMIAIRRTEPWNLERDYLIEIGMKPAPRPTEIISEPAPATGGPLKVEVEVDMEYVANAVVGFVENGYSPWCDAFNPTLDDTTTGVLKVLRERKASIWYSEAEFWTTGGRAIACFDGPEDEEGTFGSEKTVALADLHQGLRLMSEKSPKHFADLVNENDDADTHDILMQYVILGEIVYG